MIPHVWFVSTVLGGFVLYLARMIITVRICVLCNDFGPDLIYSRTFEIKQLLLYMSSMMKSLNLSGLPFNVRVLYLFLFFQFLPWQSCSEWKETSQKLPGMDEQGLF